MAVYGIAFRETSGYVTDGANDTYCVVNGYPTTRNGLTFGWDSTGNVSGRNRDTGVDVRLAGVNFIGSAYARVFRLDLPEGAGDYNVRIAAGDATFGGGQNEYWDIQDGETVFASLDKTLGGNGRFIDATNVERTSASDWVTNNAALSRTFSASYLKLSDTSGTTNNLAYVSVEPTGGGGGGGSILPIVQQMMAR